MSNPHLDTSPGASPATPVTSVWTATDAPAVLALLASGQALAGPELARRLGVSRAAVWKQVAALRASGLEILAGAQGYRLCQPLEPLDVARLRAGLPPAVRSRLGTLENHWRLDSTSSELARRVARLDDLSFIFADFQEAGRGRRGRRWISPPATNLQFSCLKQFAAGYAALSGLSLAAGIAALRALGDCGFRDVGLKWPNDLVHDDAKLGGILIELGGEFMGPCHAIVGVGINLLLPDAARGEVGRPCTDLATLDGGGPPSRNLLATALVARLAEALDEFDARGFTAFVDDWARVDALAGRRIHVEHGRDSFEGLAAGVDARGALQVRTAAGLRSVDSAEVTVKAA